MIQIDEKKIAEVEAALSHIPGATPIAIARAINRATQQAKTEAVKKVRERYIIRATDVNSTIRIIRATAARPIAIIRSRGSVMPLSKFRYTRPRSPGVKGTTPAKARVLKAGGNKPIKSAFVAQMSSGHTGIFVRAGKARLPIDQKMGPSVPQMLGHDSVIEHVEQVAQEILPKRLDHEVDAILKGVVKA